MRTAIYIDGYNLYYGALKHTPYKWLNVHSLFSYLAKENDPAAVVEHIGFYTSMIKARVATMGEKSVQAQQVYHSALQSVHCPPVKVVCRSHSLEQKTLMVAEQGKPPDKSKRARVWHTAEKKIDVCMAMDAYRMAASGKVEQIILVTNDSDHEPTLLAIKEDFPQVRRGVISPRKENSARVPSQDLRSASHWMRTSIKDDELLAHQFPDRVPTRKKPADKPAHWRVP